MPARTESRASARPLPWVVLTVLFVVSLPAVTSRLYASDEIEYFAYLRSIYFDRDLSFDNEYRYFYDRNIARAHFFKETFLDFATPTGVRRNFAPIGSALLWAPFYAIADAGVRIARAFGSAVPADGFSGPYIAAVAYGSAVYGFLALILSAAAARRLVGIDATTIAAVWIGTPLLFYMYVAPGFSHANSAFVVAAFVVTWLHVRRTWSMRGVVALGALAALMGMVREQDVFVALGPAIDYVAAMGRELRSGRRRLREIILTATLGVAATVVCFLPQALSYRALYGHFGPSPDVQQKMTWTAPNAWRVLVSPDNGWLFWTPIALPALAGLVALAFAGGERRRIGIICLVMVLTQIYVAGSLDTWAGAGSFGQRRLVGLTIFLVIGLASLFHVVRNRWPRYVLVPLVLLSIWWNLGLTAQFGTGLMDRRRVEPARNAYNNFVTIPRELPTLVYRYVLDRESFYEKRTRPHP
ncbi:MAG TPA: hypothetical protein VJM31_14295 [Vicinamibacterales bacterium]|nr:hypothetical protein [Vicinamibacterales bacterium]